jgi:hypothetical protein
MSQLKNIGLDAALIIGGAGLSTLFISTDGNGQNPLPVAAGMLVVVLISGLVSFVLARLIHTTVLSIAASTILTDVLFVLYFIRRFALSQQVHEHGNEELILLPIVFVVGTAPAVLLSCIGFGRFARRLHQRRRAVS